MSTLMKNDKTIAGLVETDKSNLGANINILQYTQSNPYITPSDGYLYLGIASGGNGLMWIRGASGGGLVAMGGQQGYWCGFVNKGMQVYVSNSPTVAQFAPLQ